MSKKETTKSILLTFLILMSLFLTWSLWTYQPPTYEYIKSATYIQDVKIGDTYSQTDIVQPIQMVVYKDNQYYGTSDLNEVKNAYDALMELSFDSARIVESNGQIISEEIKTSNRAEFIFPTAVTPAMLGQFLPIDSEETKLESIHRIIIETNGSNSMLHLVSDDEEIVMKAELESSTPFTKEYIDQAEVLYPTYFAFEASGASPVYMPTKPVKVDKLTYTTQHLSSSLFKNALFNDPGLVKLYRSENGEDSYTDGARVLEIIEAGRKIRFINPANPSSNKLETDQLVSKSIEFINNHAGWTDRYVLVDYDQYMSSVDFQLTVEGRLGFDSSGQNLDQITLNWRSQEIYQYMRSLVNLRFSIDNERTVREIPSGHMLITYLKQQKSQFNPSLLKQAVIGYEIVVENQSTVVLSFEPSWYVLYNGQWEKVSIPSRGGNTIGLE